MQTSVKTVRFCDFSVPKIGRVVAPCSTKVTKGYGKDTKGSSKHSSKSFARYAFQPWSLPCQAKELKVVLRALGFEPKKEELKKMVSLGGLGWIGHGPPMGSCDTMTPLGNQGRTWTRVVAPMARAC